MTRCTGGRINTASAGTDAPLFPLRSVVLGAFVPTLVLEIGIGAMLPVVAVTATGRGASLTVAGLVAALVPIGKILFDLPAGALAQRIGDRAAMLLAGGVAVVAFATIALSPNLGGLAAGVLALGASTAVFNLARQAYLTEITPPHFEEGPWLHKRGSLYYLTYASLDRTQHRDEKVSYSTAPSIRGPWTYRGELTGSGKYSFTIHPGIVQFKGDWYLFLHNAALTIGDQNGSIGRRAVTVEHLRYNADGTMKPVVQTDAGVSVPPAS